MNELHPSAEQIRKETRRERLMIARRALLTFLWAGIVIVFGLLIGGR